MRVMVGLYGTLPPVLAAPGRGSSALVGLSSSGARALHRIPSQQAGADN